MQKPIYKSIFLGFAIAILWAFQHPLQSPLYETLGADRYGLLKGILLAEVIGLFFFLLPFCSTYVRSGFKKLVMVDLWLVKVSIASIVSLLGLIFYAIGQTHIDGVQISILLSISPISVLVYSYLLTGSDKSTLSIVRDAITSRDFRIHLLLAAIFIVCTVLSLDEISFEGSLVPALMVLLVPSLYFGSSHFIRTRLAFSASGSESVDYQVYASAICAVAVFGTIIASVSISGFLIISGQDLSYGTVDFRFVLSFLGGAFFASFLGTWVYHYYLTEDRQFVRDNASLFFHTTPFFSILIAAVCAYFFEFFYYSASGYDMLAIILILLTIYLFKYGESRKEVI